MDCQNDIPEQPELSREVKYCLCGCGGIAPKAKRTCRRDGITQGQQLRFLPGHNARMSVCKNGRPSVLVNGKPKRIYVIEAEDALGKPLPSKAEVHHSSSGGLVVCEDRAYHKLLHLREEAIRACGHADWRRCWVCKKYDALENLDVWKRRAASHRKCVADRLKKRRQNRSKMLTIISRSTEF